MTGNEKIVVGIDPDLRDLIPGFIENRLQDVKDIRAALKTGDFDKLRILGHSMKGTGGGYGFDEITVIGGVIEDAAKMRDGDSIARENARLADYLARVEVVYK